MKINFLAFHSDFLENFYIVLSRTIYIIIQSQFTTMLDTKNAGFFTYFNVFLLVFTTFRVQLLEKQTKLYSLRVSRAVRKRAKKVPKPPRRAFALRR